MRDGEPAIRDRGGRLFVIGNGKPDHARHFVERTGLDGKVFTDPGRATYRALGMRGGVGASLSLELFRNAWRAYRAGFRQSSVQGDPWQQGGAAVVSPGGQIGYLHVARTAGDHAPLAAILAVLERLRGT